MTKEITMVRPDDWHVHLREGAMLPAAVAHSARYFGRAIVMPNLSPPVRTTAEALSYRQKILACRPAGSSFQPLMTLYLTDAAEAAEITAAKASGAVFAAKLYPAGATTHSEQGVTKVEKIYPALERLSEEDMPLLVHGETVRPDVDVFDREQRFIEEALAPLAARFPRLKIVLEHISTRDAVEFVASASDRVAATITAHHLLYNRNHLLAGGLKPHFYCLPVLKRNRHQRALLEAVAGGSAKYFLGTDSAPHPVGAKEAACGCAGCFTAHAALELYAEVFDSLGALDKLEAFASFHGPDFYGLPRNADAITLRRRAWRVPAHYEFAEERVAPIKANEEIAWSVAS